MKWSDFLDSQSTKRWHDIAYWVLLLVACVVFYWMNVLTTFKDDDMLHSMVIGELTHVNTAGDLFRSYWNKYLVLNGRSSDMLAELFCAFLGKPVFNVFNTVVFGLLAHVVSLLATGRRSLLALTLLYTCIATCYPAPGETMLWLSGSMNYLWTVTAALWVIYYLLHHRRGRLGWIGGLMLLLGTFVAGAGNEATSFAFIAAMGLYYLFNRDRLDRHVVVALVGYTLGVLLIMGSPAGWRRVPSEVITDMSIMDLLVNRTHVLGNKMVHLVTPALSVILVVIAMLSKRAKGFRTDMWPYLLLCSVLLMAALGLSAQRPYAWLAMVSLIIVINALDALLRRFHLVRLVVIVCCLAITAVSCAKGLKVMGQYKDYEDLVRREIIASPKQVVLHPRWFTTYNRFVYPLQFSSADFFNNHYIWRHYYDKENVQFVPDSVYNRFYEGRLFDGAVEMPFKDDHGGLVTRVVAFPDQDFMVASVNLDTVPRVYQVGRSFYRSDTALTVQQRSSLQHSGDGAPYSLFCYYPLRYQNGVHFIIPLPSDNDTCLLLLLNQQGSDEMRLSRTAPNPAGIHPK